MSAEQLYHSLVNVGGQATRLPGATAGRTRPLASAVRRRLWDRRRGRSDHL